MGKSAKNCSHEICNDEMQVARIPQTPMYVENNRRPTNKRTKTYDSGFIRNI